MTPRRPYLLRAMVEWAEDNDVTPLVVVDAARSDVEVPQAYVKDGTITLNVSASALHSRELANDEVRGFARFGGRSEYLRIPIMAVRGVVFRETGDGMMFADEEGPEPTPPEGDDAETPRPARGAHLKVVK